MTHKIADSWRALAEIHAAPHWLWSALVAALQTESWTVEATRTAVQSVSDALEPLLEIHRSVKKMTLR